MDSLLKLCIDDPVDLTYVGIGSCPYGGVPSPKEDQLIPACFDERIGRERRRLRCIGFDPCFPSQQELLSAYFLGLNLKQEDLEFGQHWTSETLDVYLVPVYIEYEEAKPFFQKLVQTILDTKGRLLVQDYTGRSLHPLNEALYLSCQEKELYRRRILFDLSFGTDQNCSTDMTTLQPFYDEAGNLLNFWWMPLEETLRWCGVSWKLDTLLKKKNRLQFLETLSRIHVDYRRALRGDPPFSPSPSYSAKSSPDEILKVLESELKAPMTLLLRLGALTQEQLDQLTTLFREASQQSPYVWYDTVRKLVES